MSEQSQEVPPPTSGYYAARLYKLDKGAYTKSLKRIGERLTEYGLAYRKSYRDSLLLLAPKPKDRLDMFVARTAPEWAELQVTQPDIYEREFRDFERLLERARRGELEDDES